MRQKLVRCLLFLLAAAGSAHAQGTNAESVFKQVSPSVVLVRDLLGFGSGVVLNQRGLVMTCHHVVSTPLKPSVEADVVRDGHRVRETFTNVTVVGVHPAYDLALLQVRAPASVAFIPAPRTSGRSPATGEECFVIGNPSGAKGKVLQNSISTGIISAADRTIENKRYIQTTAPINPGNSGGALCDKHGKFIGVVTFKVDEAEGLGFAIPIEGVTQDDFRPAAQKAGNREKAIRYEELADQWYTTAMRLADERREAALFMAYTYYRLALMELPNEPTTWCNMAFMYHKMGEHEAAKAFYQKCIELDPDFPPAYATLGVLAHREGDTRTMQVYWLKGMASKKTDQTHRHNMAQCADNYAVFVAGEKRHAEAAYAARWAVVTYRDRSRDAALKGILQESSAHLSDAQFKEITAKTDGFTIEDMRRFASDKRAEASSGAGVTQKPDTAGRPDGRRASDTFAARIPSLAKGMLEGAPEPDPASGLVKALPEPPSDVRPGYGGLYLLMHFKAMQKIGILNLAHGKFERYIPLAEADAIYTCGGSTLLVYLPGQRLFELWDVATAQKTGTKTARIIGELTDIEMGLFAAHAALISYADGKGALDTRRYAVMDLQSFAVRELEGDRFVHNRCYRDIIHLRADDHLTCFTSWCTSHTPTGFSFARLTDNGMADFVYEHESCGSLRPMDGGDRIIGTGAFNQGGSILNRRGEPMTKFQGVNVYPVHGSTDLLHVKGREATLRDAFGTERRKFVLAFPLSRDTSSRSPEDLRFWVEHVLRRQGQTKYTDDRYIWASAPLNRVCFINPSGSNVVIHALGSARSADEAAASMLGVKAGTRWSQKLGMPQGTKVVVEDGPEGTRYDASTDTVVWQIPSRQPPGPVQILLSITQPAKTETYQRLTVNVR